VPVLSWLLSLRDPALAGAVADLRAVLAGAGLRDGGSFPAPADAVVVWADGPLSEAAVEAVLAAGRPVVLAGPTLDTADVDGALAEAAGLRGSGRTPVHDVRVRASTDGAPLAARVLDHGHGGGAHLGDHTHVGDRVLLVDKVGDGVEQLLAARVGLAEHPVATWRPATGVLTWALGTVPAAVTSRGAVRLLLLALRHVLAVPAPRPVRVGLLGYGAIGHEHSRAVRAVPGLELAAVCDVSPGRVEAALEHAPQARGHATPQGLLADDGVDLVVVSTPPASHAPWSLAALEAGKHVVVEKPFAISTQEADAVLAVAAERGLVAACYQNRRFDPDHVAIRSAVDAGLLGTVFHVEAFVGGYGHPCNLWHSDAEVSGGAFYDWGAHVLDQLLDLVPDDVVAVTAVEHKLVWLDVTNADHSRVTVSFAGGAEATFVYSDLAAALKPRWYVLGTRGAVVGHWRTERVLSRSDIGTLTEDVLAPADSPPLLDLHDAAGSVTRLATPGTRPYRFHAELAEQIQLGTAPTVSGAQSRRVLAVMEAASRSAAQGGAPVVPL
jgi:scyllo-inositol 2-dehydrogenase (NADP+)